MMMSHAASSLANRRASGFEDNCVVTTSAPADASGFLSSVLMHCLDIRTIWSIGHADGVSESPAQIHEFIIFADVPTLHTLRTSNRLHRSDVQALVVFDGEQFENAWGCERISGSLARWAWRQHGPDVAYYNESKWAQGGEDGLVVRVRWKAVLLWSNVDPTAWGACPAAMSPTGVMSSLG